LLIAVLVAANCSALRAEELDLCYNWGCAASARVSLSERDLSALEKLFVDAFDPERERAAIALALGTMARVSGDQTPMGADRGGNREDGELNGRMDCIDHAANTKTYLHLLARRGWLKFHTVLDPVVRFRWLFAVHWAGRIEDRATGQDYAVDSWFYDNGEPPAVLRFEDWARGRGFNG
jgi:hypothetical protein